MLEGAKENNIFPNGKEQNFYPTDLLDISCDLLGILSDVWIVIRRRMISGAQASWNKLSRLS